MNTLDVIFTIGLILWFISLPITWVWVLIKVNPPEKGFEREGTYLSLRGMKPWWDIRQKALLLTWGPLMVLAALYWALKQLL